MSKIFNNRLKGKKLATSKGLIQFDANGIADIPDEELVTKLLELKGYEKAEDDSQDAQDGKKESETENTTTQEEKHEFEASGQPEEDSSSESTPEEVEQAEETEPEETETTPYGEELLEKNVPQLKKIAKEKGIDLNGANKKDEIIAILLGAMNN